MPKYLIVNADDFGLSQSVNRGIIEASERGIVTSTSLMVRQPAAAEAAAYARQHRRMSVGLHLDLGEWIYQDGDWVQLYSVVDTHDAEAVRKEIAWQFSEFRRLVGRNPSHIDSHQHAHRREPVHTTTLVLAQGMGLILRECHPSVRYCGDFYGQDGESLPIPGALSLPGLQQIFSSLPDGTTELGCHPGFTGDLKSVYSSEREDEVRVLCDPAARQFLADQQIVLCSFDPATEAHGIPGLPKFALAS